MHRPIVVAIIILTVVAFLTSLTLFLPGLKTLPHVRLGDPITVNGNVNTVYDDSCTSDADCVPAGCSSQLCVSKTNPNIITTCEYSTAYACVKLTTCGCVNHACAWAANTAYNNCLSAEATNVNAAR